MHFWSIYLQCHLLSKFLKDGVAHFVTTSHKPAKSQHKQPYRRQAAKSHHLALPLAQWRGQAGPGACAPGPHTPPCSARSSPLTGCSLPSCNSSASSSPSHPPHQLVIHLWPSRHVLVRCINIKQKPPAEGAVNQEGTTSSAWLDLPWQIAHHTCIYMLQPWHHWLYCK